MFRFSSEFPTFEDWERVYFGINTPYTERIRRLHAIFPRATLAQLRGHAEFSRKFLSEFKKKPKLDPTTLQGFLRMNKSQLVRYETGFDVLDKMKKEKMSLEKAAKFFRTSPKTVLKYLGPTFRKTPLGWEPKSSDQLIRQMRFLDSEVIVKGLKPRGSLLGKYASALSWYANTGDFSRVEKFQGINFKDVYGKTHYFITDRKILDPFLKSGQNYAESIYKFVS